MQHPITPTTVALTLAQDFDYLTAGIAYRATPHRQARGKRKGVLLSVRVDREDGSSGTSLRPWQWAQLLRGAAVAVVAPHPMRRA
jgi:hypothetical protein